MDFGNKKIAVSVTHVSEILYVVFRAVTPGNTPSVTGEVTR